MPDLQKTTLNPPNAPKPLGAYSHAVKVSPGSLVYIAGQVGVNANGNLVGPDVEAQTRQVFQNLGHVLVGAGATFANVVAFTTYLVGRISIQHSSTLAPNCSRAYFPTATTHPTPF